MLNDDLEKWRCEQEDRKNRAKRHLYCLLEKHTAITSITVDFDGNSDSGQVERIAFCSESGSDIIGTDELGDAVEEYVYSILPGGWELDEGSFGTVHIDVKSRVIDCDFAWRPTEDEDASFTEE